MRLYRRWVEATSATEAGTSLALFRIALGLCVLWTLGSVVGSDTVDLLWVDSAHGGMKRLSGTWLVDALGGPVPSVVHGLVAAGMVCGLALVVGIGGRLTALLALVVVRAVTGLNTEAAGSYDLLLANALWLAVLGDTTATLSVDARLRTGRWTSARPVGMWARYLVAFQLVVMYASTGWQKLSAYWTPGGDFSALYWILQQPGWQRIDMTWTAWVFPVTQLATAVTWVWEVTAPVLLLAVWAHDAPEGRIRRALVRWRVRDVYVVVGLVLHVSLLVLMNVGPFGPLSMALYPALYAPDAFHRGFRRMVARRPSGA